MDIKQQNTAGLTQLIVNILIPTLILVKGADTHFLTPVTAFALAISIPLIYGVIDYLKSKRRNLFSMIGLFNIALTGSIGLLKLPPEYLAIKEAGVPLFIGLTLLVLTTKNIPILTPIFHQIINSQKVLASLQSSEQVQHYHHKLKMASYLITLSFFISAILNYILAKWLVVSPTGSAAFNKELGLMTAISFPVIAVPSTIMLCIAFYLLIQDIKTLSGLTLDEILNHGNVSK